MINSWFKKRSAIKKSKELLKRTNNVLKKHREFLNPEVVHEADQKISQLQEAINQGRLKEIQRTYNSLFNFNKKGTT